MSRVVHQLELESDEVRLFEKLYVVMVNWNLKSDTLECIRSLLRSELSASQILVVDNGSTDGTPAAVRETFGSDLHVVESKSNTGYASGVNLGARQALELGAEWLLLMNNDTVVSTDFIVALERIAERVQPFSILAPLIFYMHERERIWYCGDRLIPKTLFTHSLHRNQHYTPRLPALIPVDFVSGCGMLVHQRVFEACGYFDESLFMYGEEVDYCWRARLAGFSLACVTTAHMWHKVSASANRDRPLARYLRVQNQNRFYRTYTRSWQRLLMFVLSGLRLVAVSLRDVIAGQWCLAWPGIVGWWNGWSDRMRITWG